MPESSQPDIIPEVERVVLINEGRGAGDGPKERMLTAPVISELFRMPFEIVGRGWVFPDVVRFPAPPVVAPPPPKTVLTGAEF